MTGRPACLDDPQIQCCWDDDAQACPCEDDEPMPREIEDLPTGSYL